MFSNVFKNVSFGFGARPTKGKSCSKKSKKPLSGKSKGGKSEIADNEPKKSKVDGKQPPEAVKECSGKESEGKQPTDTTGKGKDAPMADPTCDPKNVGPSRNGESLMTRIAQPPPYDPSKVGGKDGG
ncbi:hypothetical protein RDWZM_002323 [Blomia tropicalis]|uniref:Uncharacterized protein n=1 Tax=Blomia tropicalis TaxID=40697 RepID=A0A9Q0RPT7_BLOTA|nr:hypothetical protein RDWZM_002323 [Blomia tropicalis]